MEKICQELNKQSRVLKAMFDVRPVTKRGDLDMEKIARVAAVLDLRDRVAKEEIQSREKVLKRTELPFISQKKEDFSPTLAGEELPTKEEILAELAKIDEEEQMLKSEFSQFSPAKPLKVEPLDDWILKLWEEKDLGKEKKEKIKTKEKDFLDEPQLQFDEEIETSQDLPLDKDLSLGRERFYVPEQRTDAEVRKKNITSLAVFLITGFLIAVLIPFLNWTNQAWLVKEKITASGLAAYQNLLSAQQSLKQTDWQAAQEDFNLAYSNFLEANEEIKNLGQLTVNILEQLPGGSLVSSGAHLVKIGESLAQAGQNLTAAINLFPSDTGSFMEYIDVSPEVSSVKKPLTEAISNSREKLIQALQDISLANQELSQVEIKALPIEVQAKTQSLKEKLPLVEEILNQALDYSAALLNILGHDNPRQYLLLFQNNSEIRATGGFIGTYGLLTLDRGQVRKLFIEGVFNADGQLYEKIIPPRPIQKISTAWSMHDANWFADFPTSAQKVAWFYEKTGGPTVDGVIALTPVVIEQLLKLTGPIEMPEYEVTLTPENFVELIQYKVEVDYDKELNRPKKILADFAPKFIQALTQLSSKKQKQALEIIFDCLKEKHILIYFVDNNLEKLVQEQGWGGEILKANKDYLSVVSSNINGYKTDRVVEETIEHQTEIQPDGSIIDTLTITRQHKGGHLEYDWWNRVNSNYLRVYLPKGSQLLSAHGQTLETYLPPIDYQEQGFRPDPLVKSIEDKMVIDQTTGTHIFEENGKTVFGNWVYVSPGETVKITYQYKLPFKVDLTKSADSYSLLVQKQSGSLGSKFISTIKFPEDWSVSWFYPKDGRWENGKGKWEGDLKVDRFLGVAFEF
jgi:hypothetical protein